MKLHASAPGTAQVVTAYGDDYVTVSGVRYSESIVVLPGRVAPWSARSFDSLAAEHFSALLELDAEIVLLGTGPRQRFPHPRLTAPLVNARIGLEVMSLQAACRTYNILVAEERKVAAALLFE
jgi:uncharacterized protein